MKSGWKNARRSLQEIRTLKIYGSQTLPIMRVPPTRRTRRKLTNVMWNGCTIQIMPQRIERAADK